MKHTQQECTGMHCKCMELGCTNQHHSDHVLENGRTPQEERRMLDSQDERRSSEHLNTAPGALDETHECHWFPPHVEEDCPELLALGRYTDDIKKIHPSIVSKVFEDLRKSKDAMGVDWEAVFDDEIWQRDDMSLGSNAHAILIKSFIRTGFVSKAWVLSMIESMYQDTHPMEDGVPVETYGYEETHNDALAELARRIKNL